MAHLPETILVTGAGGQLGSELKESALDFPQYRFLFATRTELPIDNERAIREYFEATRIDHCINCAAYTAVDKAESDRDFAFLINATAAGTLATVCREYGTQLIHISTDYVYNGMGKEPLKETDQSGPLNVYGASKLRGEELVLSADRGAVVIRTSWVYSSYGHNFLKTMMRLLVEREQLNVVSDQIGCPTYAADLARVIMKFVEKRSGGGEFSGIYNYSNYGITSWYQFAQFIKDRIGSNCSLQPVPTAQYPSPARRPLYSVLDTSKIANELGVEIPFWKDSVAICIEKVLNR